MANSPIMKRRWFKYVVIFGIWTLVGLFYSTRPYISAALQGFDQLPEARVLVGFFADAYFWAAWTPAILWLVLRFPFRRKSWLLPLAIHFGVGVVVAALSVGFNVLVSRWLYPEETVSLVRYFNATFHWNVQWYWMIVGIAYAVGYYRMYRDRELQASQLETQLVSAQLQALKMQLQPHFLFNTLHAISELVHENADAADRMITRLGDLLRLSIDAAGEQEVPLRQELAFLQAYLEIEQTRFQDRLSVDIDVDPAALDARVPNLILQPLVENAIRHGVATRAAPGQIRLSAEQRDGTLHLVVRDNGGGLTTGVPIREGVGLRNTRERLNQMYGHDHFFQLRNGRNGGVVATVVLPFRIDMERPAPDHEHYDPLEVTPDEDLSPDRG